jgi:hypothetical protein
MLDAVKVPLSDVTILSTCPLNLRLWISWLTIAIGQFHLYSAIVSIFAFLLSRASHPPRIKEFVLIVE